ncbi:MAG TPA: hypothetical protein VK081_09490, partial [Planctomycetota bacterium]|nr:hypothetical protein [Planctomycetota bacterium]
MTVLRAVVCLLALGVVVSTALAVAVWHAVLPTYDHWVTVDLAERAATGQAGFADLWAQHNEHRLVLPRLLFLLDYFAFAGRGRSLLVMTALVQLAHVALLWRLVVGASPAARARPWSTLAVIAALLGSAAQMFNLIEPFQVQFILVHVAATAAFAAAARGADAPRAGWWAVALGAAAASALSMANGVLVLPLVFACAWLAGAPAAVRRGVGLAAVAFVVCWLWGYERMTDETFDPTRNAARPWRIVAYLACWVGSPVRWIDATASPLVGGVAGAAALAAFAALALPILRSGARGDRAVRALVWTGVFLLTTGLVTAVGRSGYANLAQAQVSRYATPCHVFWVVLCALAAGHARRGVRAAGTALAFVLVGLLAAQQPAYLAQCRARHERLQLAEAGVLCGVRDESVLAPDQIPSFVPAIYGQWLATLQHRRWSVFALPEAELVGVPVGARLAPAAVPGVCAELLASEPLPQNAGAACRVRLRAADPASARAPRLVLLAGADEVVVGLARRIAGRARADGSAEFAGYAVGSAVRPVLSVWLVLDDGRACRTPLTLPLHGEPAGGEVLGGAHFRVVEAAPVVPRDEPALPFPIAAPHATTAELYGRIDVGPLPSAGGRFALPFRTGPCNWSLSLHLVDLGSLQPLASVDAPQTFGQWSVWVVDVPPRPLAVLGFVAVDRGVRPGQWIEIARPLA